MDGIKELFSGLIELLCRFIVADSEGAVIELSEGNAGLEILLGLGQRFELFIGCHHSLVGIGLFLLSFGIDQVLLKKSSSLASSGES